jgi:hypothetical protein
MTFIALDSTTSHREIEGKETQEKVVIKYCN